MRDWYYRKTNVTLEIFVEMLSNIDLELARAVGMIQTTSENIIVGFNERQSFIDKHIEV